MHSGLFSENMGRQRISAGTASTMLRLMGLRASCSSQAAEDANTLAAAIPVIGKALPLLLTSLNLLFQPDLLFQPCLLHIPFFPETQWLIIVLVSQGCLDKLLHTWWLTTTEVCFHTVLKASPL